MRLNYKDRQCESNTTCEYIILFTRHSLEVTASFLGHHQVVCLIQGNYRICDINFFLYFADRASQYIYLNIKQLNALNFIMSLFHASTCFEHKCSPSGGQNCTIQSLVSSQL